MPVRSEFGMPVAVLQNEASSGQFLSGRLHKHHCGVSVKDGHGVKDGCGRGVVSDDEWRRRISAGG